jgi:hypothetical protein
MMRWVPREESKKAVVGGFSTRFFGRGEGCSFTGVFEISWRNVVVICGEVVVNCVVNVVDLRTLFDRRKTGHLFQLYFQVGDAEVGKEP